ncbi:MAG TPA: glycosyltransferase family 1 protein, partial [Thermoleophilaceae bacterium]|nr:glycosyltransferase family 1 protein [Thermoleophilaceae bacterium]
MRVAVDGRSLRTAAPARGVSVYLECLLAELRRTSPEDELEPVIDGRPSRAAAAVVGRPRLDRIAGGCDVVWAPAPAPLAVSPGVPLVLTVHDLSFEHRPGDYTPYERLWHRAARPRRLACRATRVIAVSEAVREQAIAEWGLDPDRVVTVLSGPGRPRGPVGLLPHGLEPGFVLAVGALEPRKRPDLLIEAHERAREHGLRAKLVFAGAGGRDSYRFLERFPTTAAEPDPSMPQFTSPRFLGRVDDPTLEALYCSALTLACPSREEGFGFTPLEAAQRGTPAVVPNLPPFDETLGDAALTVEPDDAESLADALLRLEREPGLRNRLAAA